MATAFEIPQSNALMECLTLTYLFPEKENLYEKMFKFSKMA